MGVQRRFLNLIVESRVRGTKSLCRIDLNRQNLFNKTTTSCPWAAPDSVAGNQKKKQAATKLGQITLPRPCFNFRTVASDLKDQKMQCLPVADGKVFCADQLGRGFLVEADTRHAVTMPRLRKPKSTPISLFVPGTDLDDHEHDRGSFFIMERTPKPDASEESDQFEAFVYGRVSWHYRKCWKSKLLPPLPYLRDITTTCLHSCPEISAYAVVGSEICVSVDGIGTYCLDTTNYKAYKWREVGRWTLPFYGKVEYVAEQKLWFGISAKDRRRFAAADLSVMESQQQPQLLASLNDIDQLPEEWKECNDPQLVYLGSGEFCIARFFHTRTPRGNSGDELNDQSFAVLTGVVVAPHPSSGDGNVKLEMVMHKSRCHKSNGNDDTITAVF
ncbi:hypothetical protein EJB05_11409, partial [Eragrostis curvula]